MKLRELLFLMDFNTKFNLIIDNNKDDFDCECLLFLWVEEVLIQPQLFTFPPFN